MQPNEYNVSPLQPTVISKSRNNHYLILKKLTVLSLICSSLIITSIIGTLVYPKRHVTAFQVLSPIAHAQQPIPTEIIPSNTPSVGLQTVIEQSLTDNISTYGFVVKNLKTGETVMRNEHMTFETASLYKLWVMAVTFDQIKKGKLQENTTIDSELNQMITLSSNDAASQLLSTIKLATVTSFLKDTGFTDSSMGSSTNEPTSTPLEIADFFEKLYTGTLGDSDNTTKMLELLKAQKLNSKLPKYLPTGTSIAHKTGELDEFSHDGGIVYTPQGDYIIVVMSKSSSPKLANEQMAVLSRNIFRYITTAAQ